MSTFVGLRGLARQTKFDIGGKSFVSGKTTWLNVDNPRVARDLARHSAIGQSVQVGLSFFTGDDGVVAQGCAVTPTGVAGQVSVAAGVITRASGANVTVAGGTLTLTDPTTNPILSLVAVNTTNGALVEIAGAETAGLTATRALFFHETLQAITIPADRVVLAHVFQPAVPVIIPATSIIDTRP
jgi:hypothetical protein